MADVIRSIGATVDSGTTTSTTANKLVDSGQNFETTVTVGMVVVNTTDSTRAYVTAVDSNTTLSLDADIMTTSEAYTVGGDYTTVTAWVADNGGATSANFVTNTEVVIGEMADESFSESNIIVVDATTNSTYKWILRAQAGAENLGIPGSGARITASSTTTLLSIRNYMDIEDIEFIAQSGSQIQTIWCHPFEAIDATLKRCIIQGSGGTHFDQMGVYSGDQSGATTTCISCLFFDLGSFAVSSAGTTNPTGLIYNCTAADCNQADNEFRGGFDVRPSGHTFKNCAALDCGGATWNFDFYGTVNATVAYNASSDSTATGTGSITTLDSTDFFATGSNDFHMSGSGSDLYNAGTDLSGSGVDEDIDGETWVTWSIGMDHVAAAGGGISIPVAVYHYNHNIGSN